MPSVAHSSPSSGSSFSVASSNRFVADVGISLSAFSLPESQGELQGDHMVVDRNLELGNTFFLCTD